ncbi:MAG: TetR/AcrR family transcriptional regulator [Devosiaceae bacterium]|nr:TetR/AcrR family transcriptional regulator [Devosiaceae bacterium]
MTDTTKEDAITPKQRIANSALSLFLRYGYEGTSIVQIVEASSVSKGAFYHYFTSKAQVHKEVTQNYFLDPFKKLDLKALAKLSPKKARATLRDFFINQHSNSSELSDLNIVLIKAFMFDSFMQLPGFDKKISKKYSKIIKAMARSIAKSKSPDKKAKQQAKAVLATIEGELLLDAILGEDQNKIISKNKA